MVPAGLTDRAGRPRPYLTSHPALCTSTAGDAPYQRGRGRWRGTGEAHADSADIERLQQHDPAGSCRAGRPRHEMSVELALGDEVVRAAVRRFDPHLIIAPMLTTAIPADIWSARPCFIVHPGPRGDRGPSSLDWAIMEGAGRW